METSSPAQPNQNEQLSNADLALKRQELEFKIKEYELKTRESPRKGMQLDSARVTLLVAVIGIFGTLLGILLQGSSNQKLETQKFESELILKIATSDNIEQNKKNLKFFADAGLLTNNRDRIIQLLNDSTFELKIDLTNTGMNEIIKEKKDSVTIKFIDVLTNFQKQIGKFENILTDIVNHGVGNPALTENFATVVPDYNNSFLSLKDTANLDYAFQTYWNNRELSKKYLNAVEFATEEIHIRTILASINEIRALLNNYNSENSTSVRSELNVTIQEKAKDTLLELKSKLNNYNNLISQILPLL